MQAGTGLCMDSGGMRQVLGIFNHKWDPAVLACLAERPRRYSELARVIREVDSDLTEGVLSKNLKRLVAHGLIRQEPIGSRHHAWDLTPLGRRMALILTRITDLADEGQRQDAEEESPQEAGRGRS
jgi:DNA-binding HxlR family transcriptional regulator